MLPFRAVRGRPVLMLTGTVWCAVCSRLCLQHLQGAWTSEPCGLHALVQPSGRGCTHLQLTQSVQ